MQLDAKSIPLGFLFALTILASSVFAFPASTDPAARVQIGLLEEASHWHCTMCALSHGDDKCTNLTAGETKSISWQGIECTSSCKEKLGDAHDCDITKFKAPGGGGCFCGACNWEKSCPYQ